MGASVTAEQFIYEGNGTIEFWADDDKLGEEPTIWWTGAVDTDWYKPGNWFGNRIPSLDDVVVLEGTIHDLVNANIIMRLEDANCRLPRKMGIGNCGILSLNAPFDEENNLRFIIEERCCLLAHGSVTHENHAYASSVQVNRVNLHIEGDLIVGRGSSIHANGKGRLYAGPGKGAGTTDGAGYGGQATGVFTTPTYGSITKPIDLGSCSFSTGRWSSGAIKLKVDGTFILNGSLASNAGSFPASGGSVWVDANVFKGLGGISVVGSQGSGGRIAVHVDANEFTGSFNAKGQTKGVAGTIFILDRSIHTYGKLIVDDSIDLDAYTSLNDLESVSYTFDEIQVSGTGKLKVGEDCSLHLAPDGIYENQTDTATLTVDHGGEFINEGTFILNGSETALTVDGLFNSLPASVFKYIGKAGVPVTILDNFEYQTLELSVPGRTFFWKANATYTAHDSFRVIGEPDNLITLRSTEVGTPWNLFLTDVPGYAEYVDVQDSHADSGKGVKVGPLTGDNWNLSVNSGNNISWVFGPSIGTVFTFY